MLIVAKRENLFRVVVLHHPPILTNSKWHNSLWNYKQFQKIIYNYGAELILHGHTHLPTQHILNKTANGFTPVIGVSSLVQKNGHRKPSSSYNLFEVTTYKNKACCSFQRYQLNNDNEFKISYTKIFKWNNFKYS
ncbi:metallophosphoesterase [Bartonella sp. DGB1]|uniref:metallophosphoesterase family protein n=1 Tax=Bartonella sp. DGB1 TaxID=3239807 RepID=UPI003523C92A